MTLANLIELARIKLVDTVSDYFWSDSMWILFANEAVRQACIRADLLYDTTKTISVVANTKKYAIDSTIYAIESVHAATEAAFLRKASHKDVEVIGFPNLTGALTHYILDYEVGYLYLNPTPIATNTLTLAAYRTPDDMTATSETPAINARHHIHLVNYMVYLALNTLNPQFGHPELAKLHLDLFTNHFGQEPNALDISMYNKIRPMQKGNPNLMGTDRAIIAAQPQK